jgi:hypothetical protein
MINMMDTAHVEFAGNGTASGVLTNVVDDVENPVVAVTRNSGSFNERHVDPVHTQCVSSLAVYAIIPATRDPLGIAASRAEASANIKLA